MGIQSLLLRLRGHRWLRWSSGSGVGAAAGLGLLIGLASIPGLLEFARGPSAARLNLYGRELPAGAGAGDAALGAVRQRVSGWFTLALPDDRTRPISYGALGIEIDRGRLRHLTDAAQNADSPLSRRHAATASGKPLSLLVPLRINLDVALPLLLGLKDELDQTPRDARLDPGQGVIAERPGRLLDVDRSLLAIQMAMEQGEDHAALAFEKEQPQRSSAELKAVRHDVLLGSFETPYDAAARAKDRTFNLQLAASRLDGYVLMPGEQFDFNRVVGPRDEANGYRVAKVIAEGELVDGIGGGTCQISGTLHAAALFAGLDIVERHPHTRPSAYIKLGFDAAVVYPTINLRLGNPYDFPIVLRQQVEGGRVRAEVRGAARPRTTTVVRKIEAARAFEEVQRFDERLPRGMRVLGQRGVPAFDVRRYRILRDGAHAVREAVVDHYPATPQIVRVGNGDARASAGRPPSDAQPEYLADELLVLSQANDPEAALLEQRTPGRFGVAGWTRQIGAPVWGED